MTENVPAADPLLLKRSDLENIRIAREHAASDARWTALAPEIQTSLDRIHVLLAELAVRGRDYLDHHRFGFGATSGFSPGSGIRGYVPKDLWATVFKSDNAAENSYMPQIYVIASERGLEVGFAAAIHPSDFSNSTLKAKLRSRVPAIFSALPNEDSEVVQHLLTRLESSPYRFRAKARLTPGPNDYPDVIALWRYLKSPKGKEWGSGNICRYLDAREIAEDGVDLWSLFREALDLFSPILEITRPAPVSKSVSNIESEPGTTNSAPSARFSFRDALSDLLARYSSITKTPFGANAILDELFGRIESEGVEPVLRKVGSADIVVDWSYGNGKWAAVPWLAIMDRRSTTSTQRGVYIVLLFRQDGSGAYLTLGQGITDLSNAQGYAKGREELQLRSSRYAALIGPRLEARGFTTANNMDLRSSLPRPRSYEQGAIVHKLYERDKLPEDEEIEADIRSLMASYRQLLETENQTTAMGNPATAARFAPQVWLIALGENGRLFERFYDEGIIGIGWNEIGDLETYATDADVCSPSRPLRQFEVFC